MVEIHLQEFNKKNNTEMERVLILWLTSCHISWIEPICQSFGGTPLGADHHIVSGLVPEIISKWCCFARMLPVTNHLKSLTIQQDKAPWVEDHWSQFQAILQSLAGCLTFAVARWVSQTADHNLTIAQTVGGMRVGKATLPEQIYWFHHLKMSRADLLNIMKIREPWCLRYYCN